MLKPRDRKAVHSKITLKRKSYLAKLVKSAQRIERSFSNRNVAVFSTFLTFFIQ